MEKSAVTKSSCDCFVALPPATANGWVVFGKNADRPSTEVQEVVYCEAADHAAGTKLQCTYIEIPQASHSYAVVLSKPAWMWGAEMGANQHGVCIGNEAVFTKLEGPEDGEEKLLGMDLLRLGLERGKTAKEAMETIASLLEQHGQGGTCSEDPGPPWTYHNSFLIADGSEAWVLETAGKHWAAERVTSGVRNISNLVTITTQVDAMSSGLQEYAQSQGWWKAGGKDFDFAKVYSEPVPKRTSPCHGRYWSGRELLENAGKEGKFDATSMFTILRDEDSGINFGHYGGFSSAGSQVSVIPPAGSGIPACHWFTGTPDPACSAFKPFIFCPEVAMTPLTESPAIEDDPAKTKPRFRKSVDRRHALYKAHQTIRPQEGQPIMKTLLELEGNWVRDVNAFQTSYNESRVNELGGIFKDAVEAEMKLYSEK